MAKRKFVTNIPVIGLGLAMMVATACQTAPAASPTSPSLLPSPQLVPVITTPALVATTAGFNIGGWT